MKKLFIALILFAGGITWYLWYSNVSANSNNKAIDFIASHIDGRGNIVDYQNDLGVKGLEDLKWYDNEDKIEIEFGKIRLKFEKDLLTTDKVLDTLERIHIKVKQDKETGEYKLYYNGEKIDLYIK